MWQPTLVLSMVKCEVMVRKVFLDISSTCVHACGHCVYTEVSVHRNAHRSNIPKYHFTDRTAANATLSALANLQFADVYNSYIFPVTE